MALSSDDHQAESQESERCASANDSEEFYWLNEATLISKIVTGPLEE